MTIDQKRAELLELRAKVGSALSDLIDLLEQPTGPPAGIVWLRERR